MGAHDSTYRGLNPTYPFIYPLTEVITFKTPFATGHLGISLVHLSQTLHRPVKANKRAPILKDEIILVATVARKGDCYPQVILKVVSDVISGLRNVMSPRTIGSSYAIFFLPLDDF